MICLHSLVMCVDCCDYGFSCLFVVLTSRIPRFDASSRESRVVDEDAGNVLSSMQNSMWGGERWVTATFSIRADGCVSRTAA